MRAEGQIWPADRNVVGCLKLNKVFGIRIDISKIDYKKLCLFLS
jgi:hypothetical protein